MKPYIGLLFYKQISADIFCIIPWLILLCYSVLYTNFWMKICELFYCYSSTRCLENLLNLIKTYFNIVRKRMRLTDSKQLLPTVVHSVYLYGTRVNIKFFWSIFLLQWLFFSTSQMNFNVYGWEAAKTIQNF